MLHTLSVSERFLYDLCFIFKNGIEPPKLPLLLNLDYWADLKSSLAEDDTFNTLHAFPTAEQIMDPLWLKFHVLRPKFWLSIANESDAYALLSQAHVRANFERQRAPGDRSSILQVRRWEPCKGDFSRVIKFHGILDYQSAVKPSFLAYHELWSEEGYLGNHGMYDQKVVDCMTKMQFEQWRRYYHQNDSMSAEAKVDAAKGQRTYDPVFKIKPITKEFNETAKLLMNIAKEFSYDENTLGQWTYGVSGFQKRTPGKKTAQGAQGCSMCSKFVFTVCREKRGASWMHAFEWDVSKGQPPKQDEKAANIMNMILRQLESNFGQPRYLGSQHYCIVKDSRFVTARQSHHGGKAIAICV
eukprot:SAG31_NODE_1460_length_8241_cov_11.816352_2_plen_356_part_00